MKTDRADVDYDIAGQRSGQLRAGQLEEVILPLVDRPYRVTLKARGCYPYTGEVLLTPVQRTYTIEPRFVEENRMVKGEPGILTVRSRPSSAEIWVDGQKLPFTTDADVPIASGTRQVEVRRANHVPWAQRVDVPPGGTATADATLEPSIGELLVTVSPREARILLDGQPVGEPGSYRNKQERAGGHRLTVEPPTTTAKSRPSTSRAEARRR